MNRHQNPHHHLSSTDELLANLAWMRRLATRLVATSGDAEDLTQEAALRALSSPAVRSLSGPSLRAWLARAVRGLAVDRGRAARRRRRREELVAKPEAFLEGAEDRGSKLLQALAEGLLALEEPYRTAILLHYGEGLDCAQLAQRTGATPAAVRQRLSRGRARLRKLLTPGHQDHSGSQGSGHGVLGCLPFLDSIRPWTLTMIKTWKLGGVAALALAIPATLVSMPEAPPGSGLERLAAAPLQVTPDGQEAEIVKAAAAAPRAALAQDPVPAPEPVVAKAAHGKPDPAPVSPFEPLAAHDGPHGSGADPASCVDCHSGAEGLSSPEYLPDGWRQERTAEGNLLAEGLLRLGRREGRWQEFGEGEVLTAELSYRGGREHGESVRYDNSGKVVERGAYEHGQRSGTWQAWSSNGQQLELVTYEAGRKDGLASKWWPSGQSAEESTWDLGLQHGTYRRWHANGKLAEEGNYARGHRVGAWRTWTTDGVLE